MHFYNVNLVVDTIFNFKVAGGSIMLAGKYGSLQFLRSLKLNVPSFSVITHQEFVKSGDSNFYEQLTKTPESASQKEIFDNAQAFVETVQLTAKNMLSPGNYYAIRSSVFLEDSPEHSFAGIFKSKLFVKDDAVAAIKEVWLSLFELKALQYCQERHLSWKELEMDIIIQEIIHGEKSGVLYQADPIGKRKEQIIVAGLGLGLGIVDKQTDTDQYVIENFEIKESYINDKIQHLVFQDNQIQKRSVPSHQQSIAVLSQSEIEKLLTVSVTLSTHTDQMLDIEYIFRGDELFILQAGPNTPGVSSLSANIGQKKSLRGISCATGIVEAEVEVVKDLKQAAPSLANKILVTERIGQAFGQIFIGTKGIITEKGSILSHAAIISRELGIPCIINIKGATEILKSGMRIRMNGETGEIEIL